MILSGGELVLADMSPGFGRVQYFPSTGVGLSQQFASYAAIYRKQLWVNIVVDKLALGTARLPLKVYERDANGDRHEARDSDYGRLMREPNPKHDKFFFWLWTASTKEVYGEALWVKIRDAAGIPRELWPLHPVNVYTENEKTDGGVDELAYYVTHGSTTAARLRIPERDVVHFKSYNPDTTVRGMSKIEPLRQTLLNEDAARRATSAFWSAGARPAVALKSKLKLSPAAKESLKKSWNAVTAGADNTGATVVLEEGMEAERLSLTAEEAQYIECVAPGTRFTMADGGLRPVEEIGVGDFVLAWDETSGTLTSAPVVAVRPMPPSSLLRVTTDRGRTLVTTMDHPYLASRRQRTAGGRYPKEHLSELATWIPADHLRVGDYVRVGLDSAYPEKAARLEFWANYQGSQMEYHPDLFLFDRIQSVEPAGEGVTWGVEVKGLHTHVTEGLVTHNTRKLNREEVASAYDIPPPVVHILDRATFCLPADALVMTERGSVPIVDVTACDRVWSLVDGVLRSRRVAWSGQTGFKPLLTIKTQNRTLHCTDNHPLLVRRTVRAPKTETRGARGAKYHHGLVWTPAGKLMVGDIIVTATELPDSGAEACPTREVSEGFAEFCGLLLGDGNVMAHHTGVAISRVSAALYMDHYRGVMRAEFSQRDGEIVLRESARATRFSSVSAARELTALGMAGTAHTKRVPEWVFQLTPKLRAAFLRGFLDADGSVDKKGRMSFSSCNPMMLRQVRELCIGIGVPVTNLTHRVGSTTLPDGRTCPVDQWAFTCSDPGANRAIGSHDPRYVRRLAEGTPFGEGKLSGYYTYSANGRITLPAPDGCGYAKVVCIVAGTEAVPVYDLEVDGSRNFIAEGVVVHNSNITQQMRSMYRDTMAPRLGAYESVLDKHLRPDFGTDTQYAEFLLEEVLRGDFEARADAQQKAVNSGQRTPNEMRALDNLPPMPGGDKLYINTALVPLEQSSDDPKQQAKFAGEVGIAVQRLGLGVNYNVLSVDEARTFLPGVTGPAPGPTPVAPAVVDGRAIDRKVAAKVAARASRAATLGDVDPEALTAGLNGTGAAVRALLGQSKAAGDDVPTFCALVWALAGGTR